MSSNNNQTLVAMVNFTCGDTGTIASTQRSLNAVASAAAAPTDGKWLITIGDAISAGDLIAAVSTSNITDAVAGAGVFANLTRLTDTTYELAVFSATAVVLNNEAVRVRVAFFKVDGTNG